MMTSKYVRSEEMLNPGTPERGAEGSNAPPGFHLGEQREQNCPF